MVTAKLFTGGPLFYPNQAFGAVLFGDGLSAATTTQFTASSDDGAYRMVFNLRVVEGWSHEEIARELGISIGASKSNLSRARGKLMEQVTAREAPITAKRKEHEER